MLTEDKITEIFVKADEFCKICITVFSSADNQQYSDIMVRE